MSRDDRVLPVTRVAHLILALAITPFCIGLMLHPEETGTNFSWPLVPRISALIFGSLYVAVIYSFVRVAFARRWHAVALVVWTTLPVLALLGLTTLMYWDKFLRDQFPFKIWFTAYVCFPPLLTLILIANRRRDPHAPEPGEVLIPSGVRRITGFIGVVFVGIGAALFFFPATMIAVWPWALKPLGSQAIGCLFLAPGVPHLIALREPRWSALKLVTEAALLWFTAMLISVVRCWDEFDQARPLTWVFVGLLVVELIFAAWFYLAFETKRRRALA